MKFCKLFKKTGFLSEGNIDVKGIASYLSDFICILLLVNQRTQEHQEGLKASKYEREAMQGKLNIVRHKLIEEQLEYKWLQTRRRILSNQKDECLKEKNKLAHELVSLNL